MGNKCVFASDSTHNTWLDAYTQCKTIGGELLEFHSAEDLNSFHSFLKNKPHLSDIFIGAHVNFTTNSWQWLGSRKNVSISNWVDSSDDLHGGSVISINRETLKWTVVSDPYASTSAFICNQPKCKPPFEERLGDYCYLFEMEKNATLM